MDFMMHGVVEIYISMLHLMATLQVIVLTHFLAMLLVMVFLLADMNASESTSTL